MEIRGTIKEIKPLRVVNANFSYRELILDTTWQKGQTTMKNLAKIQFCNARASLIDEFEAGDKVKINFNVYGKENTIKGKKIFSQNLNANYIELI